MRSRVPLLLIIGAVFSLVLPSMAHATGIPNFSTIVPTGIDLCPANWNALIQVINNIISFAITMAIVFVAPLSFGYAGFLMVVNPFNPGAKERAKTIMMNTVIGIVIALAGWLIVDAVMAVFYNSSTAGGTWYSLISGNDSNLCLKVAGSLETFTLSNGATATATGVDASGNYLADSGGVQCPSGNTACSVSVIKAAGYTDAQANAMSCIAITESSGNPNTPNSSTGACGTFQLVPGNWKNANLHTSPCSSATSCNDAACNLQAAYLLSQQNVAKGASVYQPWTCSGCNAKAQSCVTKYDPGH